MMAILLNWNGTSASKTRVTSATNNVDIGIVIYKVRPAKWTSAGRYRRKQLKIDLQA
jgi:hypothetical protein